MLSRKGPGEDVDVVLVVDVEGPAVDVGRAEGNEGVIDGDLFEAVAICGGTFFDKGFGQRLENKKN